MHILYRINLKLNAYIVQYNPTTECIKCAEMKLCDTLHTLIAQNDSTHSTNMCKNLKNDAYLSK